jgi:hypothetical protein
VEEGGADNVHARIKRIWIVRFHASTITSAIPIPSTSTITSIPPPFIIHITILCIHTAAILALTLSTTL